LRDTGTEGGGVTEREEGVGMSVTRHESFREEQQEDRTAVSEEAKGKWKKLKPRKPGNGIKRSKKGIIVWRI